MKRFLKILALFLAPVILLLGMFSLALVRSGELTPTADIEAAALDGGLEARTWPGGGSCPALPTGMIPAP